jgi:hypothetical protein
MQCCAKHARGAWLVGDDAVQTVWKQAGEEAGSLIEGEISTLHADLCETVLTTCAVKTFTPTRGPPRLQPHRGLY